jgi:hypothetical protein
LYLNDPDERRGGASRGGAPRYCKGDLWILANTALFESASSDGVGDKTKAPFAAAARALWHGPDKDGKMEIQLLCARPGVLSGDRRAHRVYAMRAQGSASRALAEHDAFASMTAASFPLLPHVAGAPIVKDREDVDVVAEADGPKKQTDDDLDAPLSAPPSARVVRETYGLNRDQAFAVSAALRATVEAARRVPVFERTVSPVRLVHGPFGSGKTKTLASFVKEAASRLRDENRPDFRVLITAHTNVAVDRLCKALLDVGFGDFVRVGSLRKMDPAVLSRSLHVAASGSRGGADENEPVLGRGGRPLRGKGADHARELRAMLRDATNARERAALARELRETQEGKADARARALGKCRVVATTAASCANDCLRDSTFALVVLDEASQITEPAFVAAVSSFGCETLVAVGDPKQLGPVVENDGSSVFRNDANDESRKGSALSRSRSLFARLAEAGHAPTLLRAQYRCHPALSAVANACFYGGALEDGVQVSDRAPLLRVARATLNENEDESVASTKATPMPPLVWADVATSTGPSRDVLYDQRRSAFSPREAKIAAQIVTRLVGLGIRPSDIGVVTLFKAHAKAVENALDNLRVSTATLSKKKGDDAQTTSDASASRLFRRRKRRTFSECSGVFGVSSAVRCTSLDAGEHGGRVPGPGEGGDRPVSVRGGRRRVRVGRAPQRRADARQAALDRARRLAGPRVEQARRRGACACGRREERPAGSWTPKACARRRRQTRGSRGGGETTKSRSRVGTGIGSRRRRKRGATKKKTRGRRRLFRATRRATAKKKATTTTTTTTTTTRRSPRPRLRRTRSTRSCSPGTRTRCSSPRARRCRGARCLFAAKKPPPRRDASCPVRLRRSRKRKRKLCSGSSRVRATNRGFRG